MKEEEHQKKEAAKAEEHKKHEAAKAEEQKQHEAAKAEERKQQDAAKAAKAEEHKKKEAAEAEEHKQHEAAKAAHHAAKHPAPAAPSATPAANDDDEYFEVDDERHTLRLPMHIAGNMHHDLPVPEQHHFRPMSHYEDHPYFVQKANNYLQ